MKQYNNNSVELNIPSPCQQDWHEMNANEKGKFCQTCQKQVIDFTHLSDDAILKIIEASSNKICGRFHKNQLERILISNYNKKDNTPYLKIFAGLLGISALLPRAEAKAMPVSQIQEIHQVNKEYHEKLILQSNIVHDTTKNLIQGIIKDADTKETFIGAKIEVKNTSISAETDIDGSYKLLIPDTLLIENIILKISYPGYETQEIILSEKELPVIKNVMLQANCIVLGEVVVVKRGKRSRKRTKQ